MNARVSRRSFIKLGAAGGAALFLPWRFGPAIARAQIPGPTLPPGSIPKYATPLLVPPAMPRAGKIKVKRRQEHRLLRDRRPPVRAADPAGRAAGNNRLGLRSAGGTGRTTHLQRAVADDRGEASHAGPREMGQRAARGPGGSDVRVPPPPPPGGPDAPLGEPAGRDGRPRHAAGIRLDARPLHRPRPHRDPRARLRRRGRRERRVRGGLVPAPGRQHPRRLRHRGHLVRLLPGQGGEPTATSPRARPRGTRAQPSSSIPTASARRRSGTTTTRWG